MERSRTVPPTTLLSSCYSSLKPSLFVLRGFFFVSRGAKPAEGAADVSVVRVCNTGLSHISLMSRPSPLLLSFCLAGCSYSFNLFVGKCNLLS